MTNNEGVSSIFFRIYSSKTRIPWRVLCSRFYSRWLRRHKQQRPQPSARAPPWYSSCPNQSVIPNPVTSLILYNTLSSGPLVYALWLCKIFFILQRKTTAQKRVNVVGIDGICHVVFRPEKWTNCPTFTVNERFSCAAVILAKKTLMTQWMQGKVANLEGMVSGHYTTLLEHVVIMRTSCFNTYFVLQIKLTTRPYIHCFYD